jgi:hypothetical protein
MDQQVSGQPDPNTQEGIHPTLQPLRLGEDDDRLLKYLNALEESADAHWNAPGPDGINLKERRKQNIKYLFGTQLLGRDLKSYESEFVDNVIYEFEATLKSLATSKLPDIVFRSGGANKTEQKDLTAELLTKANENRMFDGKFRKALGILFKHLPVYFVAVYKYRWDANKNKIGDIVEEVRPPENIILDHTAISADPDEMAFIIDKVDKTGKEWAMLFPKKEKEIISYLEGKHPDLVEDDKRDWLLAQRVTASEVWFDWFDKAEDFDPEKPKFDFMSGVSWKIGKDLLLGSQTNPNWDYEGHEVMTVNGQPILPEVMEQIIANGVSPEGFEVKKVFNNYFDFPRKPFILVSFDQFMRSAIDETSRIEQTIPLQKSMDKVERQTDHMVAQHKGKHVWSKESGLTKKDLKKLDMDNPNSDIVGVKGNLRNVHDFIQPAMPGQDMYAHILNRRERMFAKAGTHGATRGQVTTSVATTNQISREADFTKNDDVFDETILHVATEVSKARLHMMKLRYTEEHWKKLAGLEEGKYLELRLDNDSIDDGLEVVVTASTVDKLRAERNAQAMAELGFTEPVSFYKDMGIPNAEERAEMLFLKETSPSLYYQKFILKKDIQDIANQVIEAATVRSQATPATTVGNPQVASQPGTTAQAPINPSPQQPGNVATTPGGSPRGLLGRVRQGLSGLLGG